DIEYQRNSRMAADPEKLAAALQAANRLHARDYPATIGANIAATHSIRFQDFVASVSVRENERVIEIVRGSNPNHHQPTDKYENYGEEDFRLGFNSVKTTLGALGGTRRHNSCEASVGSVAVRRYDLIGRRRSVFPSWDRALTYLANRPSQRQQSAITNH